MVGHGGSSASSYLTDPTSPIPSHCASIVVTSTLRVKAKTMSGWQCGNHSPLVGTILHAGAGAGFAPPVHTSSPAAKQL